MTNEPSSTAKILLEYGVPQKKLEEAEEKVLKDVKGRVADAFDNSNAWEFMDYPGGHGQYMEVEILREVLEDSCL